MERVVNKSPYLDLFYSYVKYSEICFDLVFTEWRFFLQCGSSSRQDMHIWLLFKAGRNGKVLIPQSFWSSLSWTIWEYQLALITVFWWCTVRAFHYQRVILAYVSTSTWLFQIKSLRSFMWAGATHCCSSVLIEKLLYSKQKCECIALAFHVDSLSLRCKSTKRTLTRGACLIQFTLITFVQSSKHKNVNNAFWKCGLSILQCWLIWTVSILRTCEVKHSLPETHFSPIGSTGSRCLHLISFLSWGRCWAKDLGESANVGSYNIPTQMKIEQVFLSLPGDWMMSWLEPF